MKSPFVLILLVTSCLHLGPYVVHVKKLPTRDGRPGYQLECPTAPHDCESKAAKLCPGGHDVAHLRWPKRTIRCRL